MTALQWHKPADVTFETGVDRAVIYPEDGAPVPWNGLISVEDTGEAEVKELYLDGQKYLSLVSAKDWAGSLEAYMFPDEFIEMVGMAEVGDGLYVDSQTPSRFCLSYRTMITAPDVDTKQHYKIHLIYMVTAVLNGYAHTSLSGDSVEPTTFAFDLTAVPQQIPGYRPTAHVVIDTRKLDSTTRGTLEGMIYGNGFRNPEFPTITELMDLLTFSETVVIENHGDGTWTATGSNNNIIVDLKGRFTINNVNVEWLDEDTYLFLDGGLPDSLVVRFDEDNTPYFVKADGRTNLGIDTDGVPYVEEGANEAIIYTDVDGQPYFEPIENNVEPVEEEEIFDGGTVINPDGSKIIDGGAP